MAENTNANIGFEKIWYAACASGEIFQYIERIEVYEDKFIVCLKTKVEIVIER